VQKEILRNIWWSNKKEGTLAAEADLGKRQGETLGRYQDIFGEETLIFRKAQ